MAHWFVVLAFPFCLVISIITPVSQGLDEPNHFFRAYTVSRGKLLTVQSGERFGGWVPECVERFIDEPLRQAALPKPMSPSEFTHVPRGCRTDLKVFVPFDNTANYSPVAYLPQIVGLTLARFLRAPLPVQFYVGRVFALLGYIGLVFLALILARRGQLVLFVLGLLPTSLLMATSYSADGMTIGLSLLSVALLSSCIAADPPVRRQFFLLVAAISLLALTKPVYLTFAPLLLLVPGSGFPSLRAARLYKAAGIALVALLVGAWTMQVRGISSAPYHPHIDPAAHLAFIGQHPLEFGVILIRSLFSKPAQEYIVPGFFSTVGFFRNFGNPLPPPLVTIFGGVLLFQAYVFECRTVRRGRSLQAWRVLLPAVMTLGTVVATEVAFWLLWTEVGWQTVDGLQGRYFIPVSALLLATLTEFTLPSESERPVRPFVLSVAALHIWCVFYVIHLFY